MKRSIAATAACAGAALAASLLLIPAMAHHSAAMFDDEVELTLTGVVTRFDYLNPHSWLYVNVDNDDGTKTEWGFELGAPPRLRRSRISPNFWQPGDAVTIKTNPLKDGRPAGNLRGAINAEGTTFGNASGLTAPAAD